MRRVCVFFGTLLFAIIPAVAENAVQQAAEKAWLDHIFTLREWVDGSDIVVDSQGTLVHGGSPVAWTVSRFEPKRISFKRDKIQLSGKRVGLLYDATNKKLVNVELPPLTIVFRTDTSKLQEADIAAITAKLFLRDAEELQEKAPEYWRAYLEGKVLTLHDKGKDDFFTVADEPNALRGASTGLKPIGMTADGEQIFRVTTGINPPVALHTPDPEYGELAKQMHVQGQTVVTAVIGTSGNVQDVQVARPLGMGLDERAAEAVRRWRFRPATKDGTPVVVQIDVEVNFRLY